MSSTITSIAMWAREAHEVVRAFLIWWRGELRSFVPARARELFAGEEGNLRVRALTNSLQIEGNPGSSESWTLSLDSDAELPSALQAQLRGGAAAALIVPEDMVLRRIVELPLAAAPDLLAATSFLIERLTPFRLEQACHAARLYQSSD